MRSLLSPGHLFSLFLTAQWLLLTPGCDDDPKQACTQDCACTGGAVFYPEFGCLSAGFTDNDRDYDWYLTQMGTGPAEGSNCGPTSTAMALRWHNEAQDVPVATIRETITPGDTGWWYTNDIEAALSTWNTPYRVLHAPDESSVLDALDRGSVLLLCITMNLITRATDAQNTHFDRFYDYDSGHFLVVLGHLGDGEWLIVHDPNNWQDDYYDVARLQPMGRARYYRTSEVLASMRVWWPYFFEIGVTDGKSYRHLPVGRSGP